jgi:hypothetical protein
MIEIRKTAFLLMLSITLMGVFNLNTAFCSAYSLFSEFLQLCQLSQKQPPGNHNQEDHHCYKTGHDHFIASQQSDAPFSAIPLISFFPNKLPKLPAFIVPQNPMVKGPVPWPGPEEQLLTCTWLI